MIEQLLTVFTFPFVQRALIVGLSVSIAAAFLGIFITMRNLSFYADTIAHASLVGIALGLLLKISPLVSALLFCIVLGMGTVYVKERSRIGMDTVVGVLFSSSLALGVFLLSFIPSYRSELFTLLFGDILTVTWAEVLLAVVIAGIVVLFLIWRSKRLLLVTFSPDFAFIRGVRQRLLEYIFFAVTAVTVAVSIKVIGIVLIAGLLILPAAISKNIAQSFKQLVGIAIAISSSITLVGIVLSTVINVPTGPTIILLDSLLFFLTLLKPAR